jgi:hypothetical protein
MFQDGAKWRLTKSMTRDFMVRKTECRDGAVQHNGRNLKEQDLQRVRGSDFHGQRNIAVHGEGNGVLHNH